MTTDTLSPSDLLRSLPSAPGYQLGRILGRGGTAVVFQATHTDSGRSCALKVVRRTEDRPSLDRFEREARVLQSLQHPNIVRVFDWERHDDVGWMAMELADGTITEEIKARRGPLPLERALRVGIATAAALEASHEAGVVHRDVKPSNLLCLRNDVKLADFGIARTPESDLTRAGARMGSLSFMAPEQRLDAHDTVPGSDVYGLAATVFAMVTGRSPRGLTDLPFDGPRWSAVRDEKLRAILRDSMAWIPEDRPTITEVRIGLHERCRASAA